MPTKNQKIVFYIFAKLRCILEGEHVCDYCDCISKNYQTEPDRSFKKYNTLSYNYLSIKKDVFLSERLVNQYGVVGATHRSFLNRMNCNLVSNSEG